MMIAEIELHPDLFTPARRLILTAGALQVEAFRFPSGVAALEVATGAGRFVLLPFQGQQIWDAFAGERRLTMVSVFDQPLPTREFRRTYGGFFLHCGGTGMGHPGSEDDHPQHGEMPNMPFDRAALRLGGDGGETTLSLIGEAHERVAFSHAYAFRPELRFRAGSAMVEARVEVENTGGVVMPFMYLGHVNFRPVDGARIVDWPGADTRLEVLPPGLPLEVGGGEAEEIRRWHEEVARNLDRHRRIEPGDRVEPEFVALLRPEADGAGWMQSMQILTDGSADIVRFCPADLPIGVRWITRARERQALGLVLPATAAPDGRAAAHRAGTLLHLAPGERFVAEFAFGAMTAAEVMRAGGMAAG